MKYDRAEIARRVDLFGALLHQQIARLTNDIPGCANAVVALLTEVLNTFPTADGGKVVDPKTVAAAWPRICKLAESSNGVRLMMCLALMSGLMAISSAVLDEDARREASN